MKKTPFVISLREIIIGTCLCAFGLGVRADETNVNIGSFFFDPSSVTINVNDSVKWTWIGNNHSTSSDTSVWDSNVHNIGFTFTFVFTSGGNFPYSCSVHPFMTGSVTVSGGNQPPSVSITNPPGGAEGGVDL